MTTYFNSSKGLLLTAITWAFCILSLAFLSFLHPFYISICQINHNDSSGSLEIAIKVFTDDLSTALKEEGTGELYIGENKELAEADTFISRYLNKQLEVEVNGEKRSYTYLGKEVETNVSWCYVEINNIEEVKSISVTNRLFTELYDTQRNIVHIKVGGKEKSFLLQKGKLTDSLEF